MTVSDEIAEARQRIFREGYDMSFGELVSLYERKELVINPEYQRLFRWEPIQKTRFIESLLLNIPIPPIFVFTLDDGRWELVDGLQRLSTILQFMGKLKDASGASYPQFVLEPTRTLPSLRGLRWPVGTDEEELSSPDTLPVSHRLSIQRARLRIEILDQKTDIKVKFELFQRLNTGGAKLTDQEVRNCVIYALNKDLHKWIKNQAESPMFTLAVPVSDSQRDTAFDHELIVRFLVYRNIPYKSGFDLGQYLDEGIIDIASSNTVNLAAEAELLMRTLKLATEILGGDCFRALRDSRSVGKFSRAAFEFITLGLSKALEAGRQVNAPEVEQKIRLLWRDEDFLKNIGAGVRATTRLTNIVFPRAMAHFMA